MPSRIDRRGLHRSNLSLLRRAVTRLEVEPDYVLTDGFAISRMPLPHLSIKKGDAVTASVAAASIVAKVTRDRMMDRYHRRFPEYGFDRHRGYGTAEHFAALERLGPSPIHRLSFKGVGPDTVPEATPEMVVIP
jgi:ribonuclease HII